MKKQYMMVATGSVDDFEGWVASTDDTEVSESGFDTAQELVADYIENGQLIEVEIVIDVDADFTNRVLGHRDFHDAREGDEYDAEFSAEGHIKASGQQVVIEWIHTFVKGQEPEDLSSLDWDSPKRIRLDV